MKLENVAQCPLCGSPGRLALQACEDTLHGVQGRWKFRRCLCCCSLWMDPRPVKEDLPKLYPEAYFTHRSPAHPLDTPSGALLRFRFSAKLAIWERGFGYPNLTTRAPSRAGALLGKRLYFLPGLRRWAGNSLRFLPYRPDGILLDIGSGDGRFLWLAKTLGWHAIGLESDPVAADLSTHSGSMVINCSIEDADLKPESYDAITLHHTLEHLADPTGILKRLADCLRPGGLLVNFSPNPMSIASRVLKGAWRGLEPPRHLVLPSPKALASMLKDAGLRASVWTSGRNALDYCRSSFSLCGEAQSMGKLKPVLAIALALLAKIATLILRDCGEEVVCVAIKQ